MWLALAISNDTFIGHDKAVNNERKWMERSKKWWINENMETRIDDSVW